MYFNSFEFYLFFIFVFLSIRIFNYPAQILLLSSVSFYAFAGFLDLTLIATVIAANWVIIVTCRQHPIRLVLAVVVNIGVLGFFKYRDFFFPSDIEQAVSFTESVLPLGISFYTFQIISYHVDSFRGDSAETKTPTLFGLFVSFFPQLIAGPIVRSNQLIPQLQRLIGGHRRRLWLPGYGLSLCLLGLTKKIIFADSLAPLVDELFLEQPPNAPSAWLGAWLFTFQIYFDFSGYSDIAVGCAYLLGIRLPVNFRSPYISRSPREFWQRWHITLSNWIRDYVYIPLGGSRGGLVRQAIILVFVMSIAGLWHGAGWNFIIWGAAWGGCIAIARIFSRLLSIPAIVTWPLLMVVVVSTWVLFRAPDIMFAIDYLTVMFGVRQPALTKPWVWDFWILIGCASLMLLHWGEASLHSARTLRWIKRWDGPLIWGLYVGLCLWLVVMPAYTINPFIYFRF